MDKFSSRCIMASSCLFLVPAIMAFLHHRYILGALSISTTVISVNYWRDAVPGMRQCVDKVLAKFVFIVYFLKWTESGSRGFAVPLCVGLVLFLYGLSEFYFSKGNKRWVIYHVLFHTAAVAGKFFILY